MPANAIDYHRDYREKNRERINAYARQYRAANRNNVREYHRDWSRRRKYGMSTAEWESMFDAQGRRCAICKSLVPKGPYWATDHCHSTGKVRGILCNACNVGIGQMEDNAANLRLAAEYVEKHQ